MTFLQRLLAAQNFINSNPVAKTIILHTLVGTTLLYHIARFSWAWPLWKLYLVFLVLTSIKEFYIDKHFEDPKQAFTGSLQDWIGWQTGAVVTVLFRAWGI